MINVTIDGTPPEKLDRIAPQLSVNKDGTINWTPAYSDHNAAAFFRGKTLSPEEYNAALIKQIYQTNYLTDSISDFFNKQLGTVIYNNFINKFNLERSYIKTFFESDWGEQQEDGYWYIDIPAEVHGFKIAAEDQDIYERMNIDANMYILDHNGKFKEVTQVDVDTQNSVRLFTDDNTLTGFVVVRTNDKAYALAEGYIQAHQLTGLADVATTGKYADLVDINDATGPNTRINANTSRIQQIIDGEDFEGNPIKIKRSQFADIAETATYASRIEPEGYMNDVLISEIFNGPASSIVKQAVKATDVDVISRDTDPSDQVKFKLGNGIGYEKTIDHVNHAYNATNATNVNITNKDAGTNDHISFQLGNGTVFNKTINKVQHAYNAGALVDGGTIASSVTAATQAKTDDSAKVATTAFVQSIKKDLQESITTWVSLYNNGTNSSLSVSVPDTTVKQYDIIKVYFKRSFRGTVYLWDTPGEYTYSALLSNTAATPLYDGGRFPLRYSGGVFTSPAPESNDKCYIVKIVGLKTK